MAKKLSNGLSLRAGSFKFAVEAIPDKDEEVDIDFEESCLNLRQENFRGRASLDNDMPDPIKYKWEGVSVRDLHNITRMIPDDALYWSELSMDLECEIDKFESEVLNIRKPIHEVADDKALEEALYKQSRKEYSRSLEAAWVKEPEYRRLMAQLNEAKAHILGMDLFPTDEGLEFFINTDEPQGGAMWVIPAKKVVDIEE